MTDGGDKIHIAHNLTFTILSLNEREWVASYVSFSFSLSDNWKSHNGRPAH